MNVAVTAAVFIATSGRTPRGFGQPMTVAHLLEAARGNTAAMLTANRGAVGALSAALLESRSISGADAAAILVAYPGERSDDV